MQRQSEAAGCELVRFLPKKGDALIWHADLVHGGSPRTDRDLTRWSLVSHFCPLDVGPLTPGDDGVEPRRHGEGCFYTQVPSWTS